MTLQARADEIGLSRQTLSRWRKEGTNIFDDAEVKARLSTLPNLPATIAPEFMPSAPPPAPGSESQTLADLERRLLDAEGYSEARTLRAQVAGIKDVIRARKEDGQLVSQADLEAGQFGVGVAVRMAMIQCEGTLPPRLEGLDAPAMSKVIREEMRQILTRVSEADRAFWPTDAEVEEFMQRRQKEPV